jgi:hypothetical protein
MSLYHCAKIDKRLDQEKNWGYCQNSYVSHFLNRKSMSLLENLLKNNKNYIYTIMRPRLSTFPFIHCKKTSAFDQEFHQPE